MQVHDSSAARLDALVMSHIFCYLMPKDLAKVQRVCRTWCTVAKDPEVRKAAFLACWRILSVNGELKSSKVLEAATLSSFMWKHKVENGDTLQRLAVKYNSDVISIKRANKIITDRSLISHKVVYVPVTCAADVHDRHVVLAVHPVSCRDIAVVCTTLESAEERDDDRSPKARRAQVQQLKGKLSHLLGKTLHIDESTAKFYIEDADGDLKVAMERFAMDMEWESKSPGPIRTAPVQQWINGDIGF